ncbi:MAG: hypothetical protein AAFY20_04610 [Cyanobacteria bacterium J06639_14]
MRYSSHNYNQRPEQAQVKVAVYAATAEQASQQQLQEILLAGAAIASVFSVFLMLN